jgi:hypothetical protein
MVGRLIAKLICQSCNAMDTCIQFRTATDAGAGHRKSMLLSGSVRPHPADDSSLRHTPASSGSGTPLLVARRWWSRAPRAGELQARGAWRRCGAWSHCRQCRTGGGDGSTGQQPAHDSPGNDQVTCLHYSPAKPLCMHAASSSRGSYGCHFRRHTPPPVVTCTTTSVQLYVRADADSATPNSSSGSDATVPDCCTWVCASCAGPTSSLAHHSCRSPGGARLLGCSAHSRRRRHASACQRRWAPLAAAARPSLSGCSRLNRRKGRLAAQQRESQV